LAYYNEIDDIKEVFFAKDLPNWELYNGRIKNRPAGDRKIPNLIDSFGGDDISQSWDSLEGTLNRVSAKGGNAMLFLGPIHDKPKFAIPISLSTKTMTRQTGQQNNGAYIGARSVGDTIADKMKIYDLERRIQDMEGSRQGSFWEQIGERFAQEIDPNTVVGMITGLLTQNMPSVQPNINGSPPVEMPESENDESIDNAINEMVELLESNMSKAEMLRFLNKTTAAIKANPELIKNLK